MSASITTTRISTDSTARRPRSGAWRFALHYLEMVAVMFAGMGVLGAAFAGLGSAFGVPPSELERSTPALLLIGMWFSMTAPMVWWMRWRGHSAAAVREMATSMTIPTIAVLALLASGAMTDINDLLGIQHMAMLPAMLAVMLLRRHEY